MLSLFKPGVGYNIGSVFNFSPLLNFFPSLPEVLRLAVTDKLNRSPPRRSDI